MVEEPHAVAEAGAAPPEEPSLDALSQALIRRPGRLAERLAAVAGIQRALSRVRGARSVRQMLEKATLEVCESCGFDRCVVFRVAGAELIAETGHFVRRQDRLEEWIRDARAQPPRLEHGAPESEMLRRRRPILVLDAQRHPRALPALVAPGRTSSYVAAPIMPEGRVIGFLHADRHFAREEVDALDRDILWAFSEGFAYAVERTALLQRLRSQRDHVRHLMASTEVIMRELGDAAVGLVELDATGGDIANVAAAMFVAPESSPLSPREIEVLRLMADGARNAEIAERLVISEATVKSHVRHILRKLQAGNRAQAVSHFMRLGANGPHPAPSGA